MKEAENIVGHRSASSHRHDVHSPLIELHIYAPCLVLIKTQKRKVIKFVRTCTRDLPLTSERALAPYPKVHV